jgi:hypothetical protein
LHAGGGGGVADTVLAYCDSVTVGAGARRVGVMAGFEGGVAVRLAYVASWCHGGASSP